MKFTDQELARSLLLRKEAGGKRPPLSTRKKAGYVVWGAVILAAIILQNADPENRISCFLFGLVLGSVARELAWHQGIRLSWPFNEKVINWDKVKALSEDKGREAGTSNGG